MSLPIVGKLRVSYVLIALVLAGIIYAGFLFVKYHKDNVTWCVSHARLCEVYRLRNSVEELQKVNELDINPDALAK